MAGLVALVAHTAATTGASTTLRFRLRAFSGETPFVAAADAAATTAPSARLLALAGRSCSRCCRHAWLGTHGTVDPPGRSCSRPGGAATAEAAANAASTTLRAWL